MIRNESNVVMGIDYGGKRIGIAFSDPSATIATGFEVKQNESDDSSISYLASLAESRGVKKVAFGLPLAIDGTETDITARVRQFAQKLALRAGVEVDFEDERYSSLEADELLRERGMDWKARKKLLDMVASEIILQNYLNKSKRGKL